MLDLMNKLICAWTLLIMLGCGNRPFTISEGGFYVTFPKLFEQSFSRIEYPDGNIGYIDERENIEIFTDVGSSTQCFDSHNDEMTQLLLSKVHCKDENTFSIVLNRTISKERIDFESLKFIMKSEDNLDYLNKNWEYQHVVCYTSGMLVIIVRGEYTEFDLFKLYNDIAKYRQSRIIVRKM